MPAVEPQPPGGYFTKGQTTESQDASHPLVTPSAPVTTDTLVVNTSLRDETLAIVPAGTIAALTITFPADGSSRLGQIVRIVSRQIVSTVTLSAGPTFKGTSLTALAVDTAVAFQKIAANTWQRI